MSSDHQRLPPLDPDWLFEQIIGADYRFDTPFGPRLMTYADYTASGRCVRFVERYLMQITASYANTHTEDDVTGRSTTAMLQQASAAIKQACHAGPEVALLACGTGTTGALERLQQILGVAVPPASAARLADQGGGAVERLAAALGPRRPVVLLGPYEHHSNEISWRESLAEVVQIGLTAGGGLDLAELAERLAHPALAGRRLIGCFSAASNVTGRLTPVAEVARLLHRAGAAACFDFAASAPYVALDMDPPDHEACLDALAFSPHKFLGGPGSCGLLLLRRSLYRADLPPTFAGGGTVEYVSSAEHDYVQDIEAREQAGTPGTLQLLRAALALQLKEAVGVPVIAAREHDHLRRALVRLRAEPGIELLGEPDPDQQLAILSMNIRGAGPVAAAQAPPGHDATARPTAVAPGARYLHPKFVTRLLNDLFGIQSRAGCSCAGPYGHNLLKIDLHRSRQYRQQVLAGRGGLKPGWVRVGFHYTMDGQDVDFVCAALAFVARRGADFVPYYRMDLGSGAWEWSCGLPRPPEPSFGLAHALAPASASAEVSGDARPLPTGRPSAAPETAARHEEQRRYLVEAERLADQLQQTCGAREPRQQDPAALPADLEPLRYFELRRLA